MLNPPNTQCTCVHLEPIPCSCFNLNTPAPRPHKSLHVDGNPSNAGGKQNRARRAPQDIGYLNDRNRGGWTDGNPDTGYASSFEEYVVFSGLSGDAMLGDYRFFAVLSFDHPGINWALTVTMGGAAVVWAEEGVVESSSATLLNDGDTLAGDDSARRGLRRLTDDDYPSYRFLPTSDDPQTETFTVTLDSYDPVGC